MLIIEEQIYNILIGGTALIDLLGDAAIYNALGELLEDG